MKKYIEIFVSLFLVALIMSSCSSSKRERKPVSDNVSESDKSSSSQSLSSSEPSSSETKSGETSLSKKEESEYVEEIENWKDDLIGSAENSEIKENISGHIAKAKEYLDHNQDGKLQFAFFASKKGITTSLALSAIENVSGNNSYVEFIGSSYDIGSVAGSFGGNAEVILVTNSSDEELVNKHLSENGLQTSERYIMVMDASELANML